MASPDDATPSAPTPSDRPRTSAPADPLNTFDSDVARFQQACDTLLEVGHLTVAQRAARLAAAYHLQTMQQR